MEFRCASHVSIAEPCQTDLGLTYKLRRLPTQSQRQLPASASSTSNSKLAQVMAGGLVRSDNLTSTVKTRKYGQGAQVNPLHRTEIEFGPSSPHSRSRVSGEARR